MSLNKINLFDDCSDDYSVRSLLAFPANAAKFLLICYQIKYTLSLLVPQKEIAPD